MSIPDLPLQVDPRSSIPLAAQVSRQLAWLISTGVLVEGEELPPAASVADELGINLNTVRAAYRVLSEDGLVDLGRGRRARVLGFDRSQPRQVSSVPTNSLGVIIPAFVPFYAPVLDGVEHEAGLQPALVFVANAREDSETALRLLDRLVARGVDGIVVAASLIDPTTPLPPQGQPPIVYIDSPDAQGPTIQFDLEGAQYLATKHLTDHGHTNIGYITPPVELANVAPKLEGHNKALREANIEPSSQQVIEVPDFTTGSGQEGAEILLQGANPPTAIAAAVDALALGVYQAARSYHKRIGTDIAVIGNDGDPISALVDPPLSTVTLPAEQAGRLAVQMIRRLRKGEKPPTTTLAVELTIRDSCGCPNHAP
jgi:LacI family transcriptional regulator